MVRDTITKKIAFTLTKTEINSAEAIDDKKKRSVVKNTESFDRMNSTASRKKSTIAVTLAMQIFYFLKFGKDSLYLLQADTKLISTLLCILG